MKFTVKTLDGKTQTFDESGELQVLQLKQKVQANLGIPTDEQRMILQGKVLKDEDPLQAYDVEGKVIHVVKHAPPKVDSTVSSSKPRDYMYVGASPNLPPPKEVPHLQDLAKDNSEVVLKKVHDGGYPASMVTVTIHTLDSNGRPIQSATHIATTHSPFFTPDEPSSATPTSTVPQPEPDQAEEEAKQKREEVERRDRERARLNRYRERIRRQQQEGREQTNILEIYQNMTSVRRAIQGADNILEDYFASEQYIEAKEKLEHTLALKEQLKREDAEKGVVTSDNNGMGESMTMYGKDLETRNKEEPKDDPNNPQYSLGEDGRPRQHIITDTGMLLPAGSHLYAALVDDIMRLQRRGLELHEFYAKKMYAEESYEIEEYPVNERLINAVYRYQNAMSQAYAAIKKVRVTLEGQPPRIVSLLPTPRAHNPLLSLLTQPVDDDTPNTSSGRGAGGSGGGGGSGEGEGESLASLLGTLMTARAMMGMMEDDDDDDDDEEGAKKASTSEKPTVAEVTDDKDKPTTDTTAQDEGGEKMEVEPSVDGATGGSSEGATGGGDGGASGNGGASGEGGANGEGEGSGGEEGASADKPKKKKKKDVSNPYLPGPVQLIQTMMKEREEREKKLQEKRTVVVRPSSSFYETVAKIREAIGGPLGELMPTNLIGDLTEQCMKKLTMMEVVTIFGGTSAPLKSIHPLLRSYIQEKFLDNEEPTLDNIPQAISKSLEGLPEVLRGIKPPLPLRSEVDFPMSAVKCCEHVLKEVFELIITTPDDDEDFGQKIYDWAVRAGTLLTCVLRECLESSNDLETSLLRVTKIAFPDSGQPGVLSMLSSKTVVEAYMEHQEKATYTTAELEVYIVPAPEGNGEEMEVEPDNGGGLEETSSSQEAPAEAPAKKRKLESGESEAIVKEAEESSSLVQEVGTLGKRRLEEDS